MNISKLFLFVLVVLVSACQAPEKKSITIFYTADEHGWFNDSEKADGAAALMNIWKEKENYTLEADSFLVISGGDMWTGSSASTWFKGLSMMQVMNGLGYDAAALGNHEFDFSIDTLQRRSEQSEFPFLAANLVNNEGEIPAFVKPYTIVESNGVKVGLLGLANVRTPATASPTAVANLHFTPYEDAVRTYAPLLENDGADVVIIVGHICEFEMDSLVPVAKEFNIPIITGGHCHDEVLRMQDGVLLMESWAYLTSYIKVVLEYDEATKSSQVLSYEAVANVSEAKDDDLNVLVEQWESEADRVLDVPIGYSKAGILRKSPQMRKIVADSWLSTIEGSEVVIVNAGGIRQDIEAGSITMGTILGLLPFDNTIMMMTFTGAELQSFVDRQDEMQERYLFAGLDGVSIELEKDYVVLTTDFLYSLGETQFQTLDPDAISLPYLYREPSIQWIRSMETSFENPLDDYLN